MTPVKEKYSNGELLYLRGFLQAKKYTQALKALTLANIKHQGQVRKSDEPYVSHPIRISNALISLGVDNEKIIILALLHDILEDTNIYPDEIENKFGLDILKNVQLLTKSKLYNNEEYYYHLSQNPEVGIVKIADRCHNISTMYFFSIEKIKEYVQETEDYVIPLCSIISNQFPEYADYVYSMKYHIESVLEITKFFINIEKEKTEN